MKKQLNFAATVILAVSVSVITMVATGCSEQQTAAELVDTLGTAATSLLVLEGKAADATQLQKDVTAASAAITNWKSGSPTADIVEALNLVEDDLNLIPVSTQDQALIDLGIGTVDQILALFPGPTAAPAAPAPAATPAVLTATPSAKLVGWTVPRQTAWRAPLSPLCAAGDALQCWIDAQEQQSNRASGARPHVAHRKVHLAKTPKNAKEFKALWNAEAAKQGKPLVK